LTSTYQHDSQSQYVQCAAYWDRGSDIDRYQSGCCHMLSIHSQETIVRCMVTVIHLGLGWKYSFSIAVLVAMC